MQSSLIYTRIRCLFKAQLFAYHLLVSALWREKFFRRAFHSISGRACVYVGNFPDTPNRRRQWLPFVVTVGKIFVWCVHNKTSSHTHYYLHTYRSIYPYHLLYRYIACALRALLFFGSNSCLVNLRLAALLFYFSFWFLHSQYMYNVHIIQIYIYLPVYLFYPRL